MLFNTDKQTLQDLDIFSRAGGHSVYDLFNRTVTRGGAAFLKDMFLHPLSDREKIRTRSAAIARIGAADAGTVSGVTGFPYAPELFDAAEAYLANTDERTMLPPEERALAGRLAGLVSPDPLHKTIRKGIAALLQLGAGEVVALPAGATAADLDRIFRCRHRQEIRRMLSALYELDAYVAVARVAREKGFVFPEVLPAADRGLRAKDRGDVDRGLPGGDRGDVDRADEGRGLRDGAAFVRMEGVYHPLVEGAVANSLSMTHGANIVFLTGANMAGKSTLMKTIGIALYLAHLGLPVPARAMEFPVFDGMYTTINLADNVSAGASHFYSEVLRIKKIASEISLGRRLFVVFDELFRGTNVKDAAEATIAITEAFARRRNCLFVISTHIMEAGDALRANGRIQFVYLPTRMDNGRPVYSYTLQKGITDDRHGMVIIQNEGILQLLKGNHIP